MNDEQTGGIVIGSVGGDLSLHAGGDIVGGNKTIINNIIQRIAKELTTTPYKFLASYEIGDREIFYGRDAIIEELAAQVGRHKVILISGASGAGKSSLVNAGLIPRVADNGYTFVAFREYSDPLAQLQAYFDIVHSPSPPQSPTKVADGQGSLLQLIRGFGAFPIVIFLDQFERFFVRVADDKRPAFIAAFSHCLQHSEAKDLCFVLAFRREFLGQLTSEFEEQIPEFLNEAYRINLLPLSKTEAREAVLRPLEKTSLRIYYDEDFVDNVLLAGLAEQTGGGASIDPPHLQIVCNQLFEAARPRLVPPIGSVQINRALYDELGGAQNILNTYLDKVVEDVAQDPERITVVRAILKTMVDTGTNTRTFVAMEGFNRALPDVNEAEILKFIEKLLDRRVVEERKPAYSLSHEHMVGKVKEWFDPRELERKRAEETLNRGMMEWKNSGALLNRGQVERIRKWLPDPAEEEHELLQASEKNYHEEERKEVSRKKLRKRSLYGAVAFAVIVMILGIFSLFKMREADYLALQRQGDQALNQLVGGDLAAGVASLGYVVGADTQRLLKPYASLLGFWLPRLASIDEIKRDAAVGDLVQWRGQIYVKADERTLALLPVRDPFRAASLEGGRELLLAHNTGVSLLGLPGPVSNVEFKYPSARTRPEELYAAPVPGVYVSIGRRTVITNDEDHPEEIHSCLAILLSPPAARSMAPLSDCSEAAKEGSEYDQEELQMTHAAGANGWIAYGFCNSMPLAVRRIDVSSEAVIALDGLAQSPTRIAFDARACRVKTESVTDEDLKRPSAHRTLTSMSHLFPRRKEEQGFWKILPAANDAPPTPSASTQPDPEIFELSKSGDFRALPNAEEVISKIENNDAIESGTAREGNTRYPWFAYVSGNSFQTILACEVVEPNRVKRCNDVQLGAIRTLSPSSPDRRWIAYAPCNSTEEPLTLYDMRHLDHKQALPSSTTPDHTVVAVTFSATSDRAAAQTEADELFVFDTAGDQLRPMRKVELAGNVSARRAPRPGNESVADGVRDLCGKRAGADLRFANDRTVVGLTMDGQLFAVNVDTGDVLWRRAPPILQETGPVRLVTGKRRDLFVISVGSVHQLFDAATGTPVSDAVDVAKLVPQPAANEGPSPHQRFLDGPVEVTGIGVAEDGSVEITLSDSTRIIRQPPLTDPALRDALKTSERATGFSSADGRSVLQRLPD
jgi:hypothetical protein